MQIDRDEALELCRRKMPVLTTGGGRPTREVRSLKEMPPEPGDDYDGPPLEYHRLRDDHGNWTRAGMEHAIRSGGSVMHRGQVIERIEDLPDEAELAAGDAPRLEAQAKRIDAEIAKLSAQRAHLSGQQEDADKARQAAKQRTEARQGAQLKDDMDQSGQNKIEPGPTKPAPGPPGRAKKE